jgi:Holliday junction resolvasome RuvABC endonuclease subunit
MFVAENVDKVFIESFVMRGKGGETLARLTGALISTVPDKAQFKEVQNTSVKKIIGGSGSDDKKVVANALLKLYPNQVDLIQNLIDAEDYDALDALAIVTAGLKNER